MTAVIEQSVTHDTPKKALALPAALGTGWPTGFHSLLFKVPLLTPVDYYFCAFVVTIAISITICLVSTNINVLTE